MTENSNKKYTDEERYKRGIDRILKSDQYTEEYKKMLLDKLGNDYNLPRESVSKDVEFDLLKEGGIVISLSENENSLITVTDKPKAVSGYLEKPTYLEDELKKAVDVEVDELIKQPPKQKPLTVPKEVYDDLTEQYNIALNDLEDLREELNRVIGDLEDANAQINLLNQTVDSEKLLRAAADNETQASTERYVSVLRDFQVAMQKGIQEAIERVSLTAQVRGLQAQKEVLQQQLESLKAITESLQGQIETQQLQIAAQQQTIEDQQEDAAASFLLTGAPGTFEKTNQSGWKIPSGNVGTTDINGFPLFFDKKTGKWKNGDTIEFYNLSSEEDLVFTLSYELVLRKDGKGDNWNKVYLEGPQQFIVPKRVDSDPGIKPVQFSKKYIYQSKLFKVGTAVDRILVKVSNGDEYDIKSMYRLSK